MMERPMRCCFAPADFKGRLPIGASLPGGRSPKSAWRPRDIRGNLVRTVDDVVLMPRRGRGD